MNNPAMNTQKLAKSAAERIASELDAAMGRYDNGRGIGQAPLSRASNVSQPTISRALSGKSIPELETLVRLIETLNDMDLGRTIGSILRGYKEGITYPQASLPAAPLAIAQNVAQYPTRSQRDIEISKVLDTIGGISDKGLSALLYEAMKIAEAFPRQKETPKSST